MRRHGLVVTVAMSPIPTPPNIADADPGEAMLHYPELPADDPLHIDLGSVPEAATTDVDDLAEQLAALPIDEALRDRVDDWLRNGGDDALERALSGLGDNAMQVAFALLYAAPAPVD